LRIILLQDIKGTGKKGEIKEVSDGYARNFLFPRKLAVIASSENVEVLNKENKKIQQQQEQRLQQAYALKKKINDLTLQFSLKTGEKERVFGSITTKQICQELKNKFNIVIDKKQIMLEESIRSLGVTKIQIKLYTDVVATLAVQLLKEKEL
jgi:large subunit ribosomal protein L9